MLRPQNVEGEGKSLTQNGILCSNDQGSSSKARRTQRKKSNPKTVDSQKIDRQMIASE
jgi:hypothetical protein